MDYRMLAVTIVLWAIAASLILANRRNEANIWCAVFAFVCGLGGVNTILADTLHIVVPPTLATGFTPLLTLHSLTTAFIHYAAPYAYLIFALSHSGEFGRRGKRWRRIAYLVGLLPLLVCSIFFPPHIFSYFRDYDKSFWLMSMWIIPLEIYASFILVKGYVIESNPRQKTSKLIACVIMIPATMYAVIVHYVLMLVRYTEVWRHEWIIVLIALAAFIIATVRVGLMGIRITIERQCLNTSLTSAQSGTAMIGHAIKNSLAKLEFCIDNIKNNPSDSESLEIAENTISHLKAISTKMTASLMPKKLHKETISVSNLLDSVLDQHLDMLKEKQIKIVKNYSDDRFLFCDIAMIREVFANIIINAIEASHIGGSIEISIAEEKRKMKISFKDNGVGIPKEAQYKVFNAFYTTKKSEDNSGLGLSFCYNVMMLHGGKIDVFSNSCCGTTVSLAFNKRQRLIWKAYRKGH